MINCDSVISVQQSSSQKTMAQETVDNDIGDRRRRVPVTTEKPYTGIAHLQHENGKAIGTGFLVKCGGRLFLVTAAHCLWDRRKGAFKEEIDISLGRDGENLPFETIRKKAVDFEVPREYKETGDAMYDYGIIRLDKEKHKLDKCCTFDLEPRTDEYIESQDLYMSGYPGIPEERRDGVPGWPPGTQWKIKLTTVTVNKRSLQYRDATTPGNSGSPVYEMKDGRYVAHGIHTNGIDENHTSNEAGRIDVEALMKLVKPTSHGTRTQGSPPQQDGKVPNNNHPKPVKLNWLLKMWNKVKAILKCIRNIVILWLDHFLCISKCLSRVEQSEIRMFFNFLLALLNLIILTDSRLLK